MSKQSIEEIQKMQKAFILENFTSKIKHKNLSNYFEKGGLKNVDMNLKIARLQCSWIKLLYGSKFQQWKLILFHLVKSTFGIKFNSI